MLEVRSQPGGWQVASLENCEAFCITCYNLARESLSLNTMDGRGLTTGGVAASWLLTTYKIDSAPVFGPAQLLHRSAKTWLHLKPIGARGTPGGNGSAFDRVLRFVGPTP